MSIALVVGCGECVWSDAARFYQMATPDAVIAVKNMIYLWPTRVDYGVNLHPDRSLNYLKERQKRKRNVDFEIWAHKQQVSGSIAHRVSSDWQGGTGLLAVKIALEEGFDGVVLVGVPMDPKQGHIVRHKPWPSAQMFQKGWKVNFGKYAGRTKSMSGWTLQLLGEPDAAWLRERGAAPPNLTMSAELSSQLAA